MSIEFYKINLLNRHHMRVFFIYFHILSTRKNVELRPVDSIKISYIITTSRIELINRLKAVNKTSASSSS